MGIPIVISLSLFKETNTNLYYKITSILSDIETRENLFTSLWKNAYLKVFLWWVFIVEISKTSTPQYSNKANFMYG